MAINRRRLLALLAAGSTFPGVVFAKDATTPVSFRHGVASGDPLQDRVVLWTRVTPNTGVRVTLPVQWEMAEEDSFSVIVAHGETETSPDRDNTVKIDASGLQAGKAYVYRFRCNGVTSPVGRTRTLPRGAVKDVVLAFVTCSLYPAGYFNAYDHIAKLERVDAVVELGDYIYEYGAGDHDYGMDNGRKLGRIPEPAHEIVTLADYRMRHALYKRDADLQAAHARCPWICVWDDHEVCNDTWVGGAENHQPKTEGSFLTREEAAIKAYYEWMPIRDPAPGRAIEEINRAFQFGDLASLLMLETRLVGRSYQLEYDRPGDVPRVIYDSADPATRKRVSDPEIVAKVMKAIEAKKTPPAPYVLGPDPQALKAILANPERRMMSARQEEWLEEELTRSVKAGQAWQVLGNQVVMARTRAPDIRKALGAEKTAELLAAAPADKRSWAAAVIDMFTYDVPFDLDGWDGYPAARERMYDAVKRSRANTVIVSGDSHAFWANELGDAGGTRVAVEFGTSAVTSPSPGDELPGIDLGKIFVDENPEVKFCDQSAKGYVQLTLTQKSARAEFISVQTMVKPYDAKTLTSFEVKPKKGGGTSGLS